MGEVLVSVRHAHGSAAVVREGDRAWLAADGSPPVDAFGTAAAPLPQGLWVVAGLLPVPATRAVLRAPDGGVADAAVGEGAWLGVSFTDAAPVRFEAADGLLIKRPTRLTAYWHPVPDPSDPCPACNGRGWEHAEDEIRCAACGFPVVAPAPPAPRGRGRLARRLRARPPRYVAAGVRVATAVLRPDEDPADRLRAALLAALEAATGPCPDGSPAAQAIWRAARLRQRRAAVARAVPFPHAVSVDGATVAFDGLRAGSAWGLAATVRGVHIAVAGNDPAPYPDHLRRADR